MQNPQSFSTTSTPKAFLLSLFNWLIPGAGFLAVRDFRRGIPLMILINGVFIVGLVLNGYIFVPEFKPGTLDFNIVSILMFLVQCFHGGGTALLLFLAESNSALAQLLVRDPGASFSDLGSFHLVVAGGLNYFASIKLFDDLVGYTEPVKDSEKERENESKKAEITPVVQNDNNSEINNREPVK